MIHARQSEQAFWLAEAGIRKAIQQINLSGAYRNNPTNITATLSFGSYQVEVTAQEDFFSSGATNYTLVSTGRVLTMNRRVRQELSTSPGFKFPIVAKGGTSSWNSNSEVNGGPVAVFGGSVDTGNNSTVDIGELLVDTDVTVSGSGNYSETEIPIELQEPTLNTLVYESQFNAVAVGTASATLPVSARSIGGTADYTGTNVTFGTMTVADGTVIRTDGDIIFNGSVSFSGPVRIYAGGNVVFIKSTTLPAGSIIEAGKGIDLTANRSTLGDGTRLTSRGSVMLGSQATIGSGVNITAGVNVDIAAQANIGGRTTIYAHGNLTISSGGANEMDQNDGIALLANGNIEINSNMNPFYGIMFANGKLGFNANLDIHGTVVGGLGFSAASNVDFFYQPGAFDWALNPSTGIQINTHDVVLRKGVWQEISSL